MEWSSAAFDPQQVLADLAVGVVVALALSLVFGLNRRTILVAVLAALGVNQLYPDGAPGLLADLLRPLTGMSEDAASRGAARHEAVEHATGEPEVPAAR